MKKERNKKENKENRNIKEQIKNRKEGSRKLMKQKDNWVGSKDNENVVNNL